MNNIINSNVIRLIEVDKLDAGDTRGSFITNYRRDNLGRLVSRTDSAGNITKYGYNSRSKCTLVTDALNNQTRREFDGIGRLIRTILDMDGDGADANDPSDIVTQTAFDDNGRRISSTDANGNTTVNEYDALGRETRVVYADGTERQVSFDVHGNPEQSYDADGDVVIAIYDKLNRLKKKSITVIK